MKYERLTKETVGSFGYDLKDFEHKPKEFNDYDAFYAYKMAVKRLGELEDKIESGEIDYVADRDKEIARLTKERDSKEEAYNKCYFDYKNWKDKANEYKHRAEVVDRALQYAVSEYRCDECPCLDCNAEIRGSQECIDCICAEYIKEAEKDIAEEVKE